MVWVRAFALSLCILFTANLSLANEAKVQQFADSLAGDALKIVNDPALSSVGKQQKLEKLFSGNVDIKWVAKFVLGKHWRNATDAQKQAYLKHYEAFVLKNYTSKITGYTGQDYIIKSVRNDGSGEYLLTMELKNANEPDVLLDYRIRKNGSGYKIFDIIVEGVSMITTQRSEFSSVISNKGLDFLIDALKKKAAS